MELDKVDCIFCQIAQGKAPASVVFADDVVTAFLDIQPMNAGHVLVVPNRHAASLSELDDSTAAHLFVTAKGIASALRASGLPCEGINLFLADGEAAFQDVFHAHVHVVPRYTDDGIGLRFGPQYGQQPGRAELDVLARRIRLAGGWD